MRIFVTGATGFVGAHFIERALDAGHAVTGLYRSDDPRRRTRIAQRVKRVVLCSTAGIYGQRASGIIDERAPIRPSNNYERSKVAAENEIRDQARAANIEYVILRPATVYGPRDERLQKLFRSVAKGRFPLFGAGDGRRHLIYVTDLADASLRSCTESGAANQELIVAGPRAVPLHELLDTLARAANRPSFGPQLPLRPMLALAAIVEDVCNVLNVTPPIYRRRMDFYTTDIEFDSSRARQVLNWQPKVDLADGLAATLRAEQGQGAAPRSALCGMMDNARPLR